MSSKIKETLSLEFDAFSANYTSDMIVAVPHYEQLMRCFQTCLPLGFSAKHILDLGAGNGNSANELMQRFPDAEYTLVDASAEMLDICNKRFTQSNIKLVESYFSDFQFNEEAYDLVIAGFSLHHCKADEKQSLFKKIKKALKPNGLLMMSDLCITKSDDSHPALLKEWETYVNANDPSGEKWTWLMEHYDAFDTPHNFESQHAWLLEAGFSSVDIGWNEGKWMHVIAG